MGFKLSLCKVPEDDVSWGANCIAASLLDENLAEVGVKLRTKLIIASAGILVLAAIFVVAPLLLLAKADALLESSPCIGQPPSDDITIPYREAMFRALTISFSYSSKFTSWERALSMFQRGVVEPNDFITHVLPLEEWQQGFALVRNGDAIKVVLEP